ncbi:hypothetical protein [Tuwongella immobilis]|uniref:Uncharacterized protein n=1 Tax=Tuwongella immobilis TaxID=692036 RepID=A0A6C2YV46_9BACT|nr:hypothetical protein [Tuwongella immobilis]VIP05376.1 unnamed protein product [Tuwongella immobilis]VTS08108.1 unnamed protein product [Tuwongella immobilis]
MIQHHILIAWLTLLWISNLHASDLHTEVRQTWKSLSNRPYLHYSTVNTAKIKVSSQKDLINQIFKTTYHSNPHCSLTVTNNDGQRSASICNRYYSTQISGPPDQTTWKIDSINLDVSDPTRSCHDIRDTHPWLTFAGIRLPEILDQHSETITFEAKSSTEILLHFRSNRQDDSASVLPYGNLTATLTLDRNHGMRPIRYVVLYANSNPTFKATQQGEIQYHESSDNTHRIKQVNETFDELSIRQNVERTRTVESETIYEYHSESREDDWYYTLSAFDLPEPVGVHLARPTPVWVWLLTAAGVFAAAAGLFRWLQLRPLRKGTIA